jgi:S-formylglutathione hydrolase FrmB
LLNNRWRNVTATVRERSYHVRYLWAAVAVALAAAAPENLTAALHATAAAYYANAGHVADLTGRDNAMDYYDRLVRDQALLSEPAPNRYPLQVWRQLVEAQSRLDLSLATQLLDGKAEPIAAIRGLGETLIRSSADGTMQPASVYVPTSYSPQRPASLMVFLHGNTQSESSLLAPEFIQKLAESAGTIVVAPYGRGVYDYAGAENDVYDALDAATRAFAIDPHKRFLAGYSMGGFSLFRIAPIHPNDWSAVMSVAGSLLVSRAPRALATLSHLRFYILTGARDENVPTAWPTATAIYLRDAGFAVTFYSQPEGTHRLYSLQPILTQAWQEMENGVVRSPAGLTGAANLPDAAAPQ